MEICSERVKTLSEKDKTLSERYTNMSGEGYIEF
jgi:hypothetical protein